MFVVIFEVQPKAGRWDDYLDLAKQLKPKLEATDGFIDNERFKSKQDEGRVLSLSTWRDEKAVVRWRTHEGHHGVQEKGRFEVFQDYHLRVGEVITDTQPPAGHPLAQTRLDETEVGAAKAVTLTEILPSEGATLASRSDLLVSHLELDPTAPGLLSHDVFESIYNPGKLVLLASWKTADAAKTWQPDQPHAVRSLRHRRVRVIRDYGMFERREAPQYYPDVDRKKGSGLQTGLRAAR
ncbi:antibiotic biosynthesis monooxygenase [Bradyrhizobium sp. LHD-71]|uniref:antibiotic biosynthesis monooxygenase family protein n=1 Tax=Bradyrhizobium sp. LHD-71 TaxID=3072141 RepID=UPI00280F11DC|nr:antibiotic biosynthesis monooxygenase [Bradyrhizobium sp. LHD-71]MDQ8729788.1 antibiotic biosynthesis monooxygenase [Bradyrhizobium sp. LHD-71]